MADEFVIGIEVNHTFLAGGSNVKLFRGDDLALVRRLKNTLERVQKRDAKVAASTARTRVNRMPILDDGTMTTAGAVNRILERIQTCLDATRTH